MTRGEQGDGGGKVQGAGERGERDADRRGEIGIGIQPILLPARLEMTASAGL